MVLVWLSFWALFTSMPGLPVLGRLQPLWSVLAFLAALGAVVVSVRAV